jgi:hypothetical protein
MVDLERTLGYEHEPTAERVVEDIYFDGYRRVVDDINTAFRDTGLIDPEGYEQALRDQRTVRLRIGSVQMPLLAPIDYALGYDVGRTKRLTGNDNVLVMALPPEVLSSEDVAIVGIPEDDDAPRPTILVETDSLMTSDVKATLPGKLAESGFGVFVVKDFLDDRIDKPEDQAAFMGAYSARFSVVDIEGEPVPRRSHDFMGAYRELVEQGHPLTKNTKLLDVQVLRDDPGLVNELWDFYRDRFEWLGEKHPVSMEDSLEFFLTILLHNDTRTVVRYDDQGNPLCLGFFISGLDECQWMSEPFRNENTKKARIRDEGLLYFYSVASKIENAHLSRDVMQLIIATVVRMGGDYRLIFESTNMSSQIIPRLVSDYIEGSGNIATKEPVKQIKRLDYWWLNPVKSA